MGAGGIRDLDRLLAGFSDGAFAVGPDGRIELWNRGAERILGYGARELVGKPCHDAFPGRDADGNGWCHRSCQVVGLMKAGDGAPTFEVQARTKAGRPVWLSMSTLAAREPDGGEITVHLFRDVTEARELLARIRDGLALPAAPVNGASGLTRRELEVLRLIASGASTKTSAERLQVSHATVRNHVQNILVKLGAHSRLEAVACATRHRLI